MRQVLVALLMLAPLVFVPTATATEGRSDSDIICCTASDLELFMLGSADSGTMSPFEGRLADEPESAIIANAVTSEEVVATWRLQDLYAGTLPDSTWSISLPVLLENAGGAQVNFSVEVAIGSNVYVGELPAPSTFVGQGESTISFDIPIEESNVGDGWDLEIVLLARSVVFSVPEIGSQLSVLWGADDAKASISGEMSAVEIRLLDVEIEGADAYIGIVLSSPFGTDLLAFSEDFALRLDGTVVSGDPVETQSADGIRVTWTYTDDEPGERTMLLEVTLRLQTGAALITSESREITFITESGEGGGGTYYPSEEPVRTTGAGSSLFVVGSMELSQDRGELILERETSITLDGEMSFWMRWSLDHLGSEDLALSPTIRSFRAGGVGDEERESRMIESVERQEFEQQMGKLHVSFLSNGLGLKPDELIGDSGDFDTVGVSLDLHGEERVDTHPLTVTIRSRERVPDGTLVDLVRDFIVVQPVPFWSDWSIDLTLETSGLTSLVGLDVGDAEGLNLNHRRMPMGEMAVLSGEELDQGLTFELVAAPTSAPLYAPLLVLLGTLVILGGGFATGWRVSRQRRRALLMTEVVLLSIIVVAMFLFAYPSVFVLGAAGSSAFIWAVSAFVSPRTSRKRASTSPASAMKGVPLPTFACPACGTVNDVPSHERPLRIVCQGCNRGITIQG